MRLFPAHEVDDEMPGNAEQPDLEFPLRAVLMSPFQDVEPGLLENVVGSGPIPRQRQQISDEPVLILPDQPIDNVRIAPAQRPRQFLSIVLHSCSVPGNYGFH
jgi:hypothetical protein